MKIEKIKTVGDLKKQGYQTKSIKDELRDNLILKIKEGVPAFEGIHGFEETVIPEIERAILSKHNINLLGLRGQAKTKLARLMVQLLDEYIPFVAGSEINDDPLAPISRFAKDLISEKGDDTPIEWLHRNERFFEKLARLMIQLLDEYIPFVAGSEINDDPLAPISRFAKDLIAEKGDATPIEWLHQAKRLLLE